MSQHAPHVTHEPSSVLCTCSDVRQTKNVHPEPDWTREHAEAYRGAQAWHDPLPPGTQGWGPLTTGPEEPTHLVREEEKAELVN